MEVLGSIATTCFNCVTDLVVKHVKYTIKVGENVEVLNRSVEILEARRKDVGQEIKMDERVNKKATTEVEEWQKRVDVILTEARAIKNDYDNRGCIFLKGCSFNCFTNHSISRRAVAGLLDAEAELKYEGDLKEITVEVLPPSVQAMSIAHTVSDGKRKSILEKVPEFLRDDAGDAHGMLGLWGMGGVGKTTLLQQINNSLAKDTSFGFDFVVYIVASNQCTIEKIQKLLVEKLGLSRAGNPGNNIYNCLNNKNFVLLLDDLWERLDLGLVGIPLPLGVVDNHKRKVILTSRFQQVCHNMGTHQTIKVSCLSREAARLLFRETVGEETINYNPRIRELAMDVADECHGLPLAIITIGRAMVATQEIEVWENTIDLLRKSKLSKIPGTDDPFQLLKTSYDFLKNPIEQECFLHCALWPEDEEIEKEELIKCWMGHGLLGEFETIREAYNRGHTIINSLQNACLLEHVEHELYLRNELVKMHDVIRDMALWIARECGANEKKWMVRAGLGLDEAPSEERAWSGAHKSSLMENRIKTLPSSIRSCPNLTTLLLQGNNLDWKMPVVGYFHALKYLDISRNPLPSFPKEICRLEKLEYLDISNAEISSLPEELKNLVNLKYLFLHWNQISELPDGLLSKLIRLSVLDVCTGFYLISQSLIIDQLACWEGHLKALGINAFTLSDLRKLSWFSGKAITALTIGKMEGLSSLELLSPDILGSRHICSNLKKLIFTECNRSLQEIIIGDDHCVNFDSLQLLWLDSLHGLKDIIWTGARPSDVFQKLREIDINRCPQLKHAKWVSHLPLLERLHLFSCDNMECVVSKEEGEIQEENKPTFPSLRILRLFHLPRLDRFCDLDFTLPSLEYLTVSNCPKLKKLPFNFPTSCPNLRMIKGGKEWWESLSLEDDIKSSLSPLFKGY